MYLYYHKAAVPLNLRPNNQLEFERSENVRKVKEFSLEVRENIHLITNMKNDDVIVLIVTV